MATTGNLQNGTKTFGQAIDFEADPNRAADPVYAVISTIFFWISHDLPSLADQGLTEAAVEQITRRINGSDATNDECIEKMAGIRDGGQFDRICRFSVAHPRFEDAE